MKTPDEAKKLLCPLLAAAHNKSSQFGPFCQAGRCLFWQKDKMPNPMTDRRVHEINVTEEPPLDHDSQEYISPPKPDDVPPHAYFCWDSDCRETYWEWEEPDESVKARWPGDCRLAGQFK